MAFINVDGLEMHYELRGEGPTLVLIAGTAASGDWNDEFISLISKSFRVLTYDHRGTGSTGSSEGLYTTQQFARDAVGLMSALNLGPSYVLGHSMGGRVAQYVALDHPKMVRGLIQASAGPGEFPGQFDGGRRMERGVPLRTATLFATDGYTSWIETYIRESMFTPEFQENEPDIVQAAIDRRIGGRPDVADYLKHVIARQNHQTFDRLHEITCPTLVVVGGNDIDVGGTGSHFRQSLCLAEHLPNATLKVLPGLQHGYFDEAPQLIASAITEWTDGV